MLFVEQRDGGSQVELASEGRSRPIHPIEGVAIAYQDVQVSFTCRRRNLDCNLPYDPLAPIGSQNCFDRNLVTGTDFGDICAGAFEPCPSALAYQIEVKLNAVDRGRIVRVV